MGNLVFVVGYGAAWWLAWSSAVLAQRNRKRPWWRQHLMGLWHGFWFATVVGMVIVPPAAWWGYLLGGFALFMLWACKGNLRAGRSLFDDGKTKEKPTAAAQGVGGLFGTSLAPKRNQPQVIKARAAHAQTAADMALKRAAWGAEPKQEPLASEKVLQQLCRDMTADGSLDVEEVADLWQWVKDHPDAVASGLPQLLAARLDAAWRDGIISTDEAFGLFDLASAVATGRSEAAYKEMQAQSRARPSSPRPQRRSTSSRGDKPRRRGKLDTIYFTYQTADGDVMDRHVIVHAVDDDYIEGVCLLRKAVRTFRLDRIIGDVTSEETGEVADPWEWAAAIEEVPARLRQPEPVPAWHPLAGREVLFTGFAAAERLRLEGLAMDANMIVRKSVTQNLDYLVAGPRAGAAKLAQAEEQLVEVISGEDFEALA